MAARLKVYCAPSGFEDALVAAPSQKAALAAWGARGDLFALGQAHVVTDEKLTAEALASPGEVIRRPRGDLAAMLKSAPKPKPVAAQAKAGGRSAEASRTKPAAPPDRAPLDAAEAALEAAKTRLDQRLADLAEEQAALEARKARIRKEGEAEVEKAQRARDRAREAFRKAGGER